MKRTDIHRPSAINPSEYVFVAFDYIKIGAEGSILGDCAYLQEQRRIKQEHFARTGGKYSDHEHGGNCMVCGNANAIYTATFHHAPSNTYVRVGQECAEKLENASGYSDGEFSAFRKSIHNALEARAGKNKAKAVLHEAGLDRAWELYEAKYEDLPGKERTVSPHSEDQRYACASTPITVKDVYREELIIRDIVGKLVRYGSISELATNYIGTLLKQIAERPAIEAQRKAEHNAAQDCPEGRIQITGVVLALKTTEGRFGVTTKMLVQDERGFKVWGSRTQCFEKGDKVTFTATVERSKDDSKFGFFKRPTKGEVIVFKPTEGQRQDSVMV